MKTILWTFLVFFMVGFISACSKEDFYESQEAVPETLYKLEGEDDERPMMIYGTILNTLGTPVSGAYVALLQPPETLYEVISDAQGYYQIDSVAMGCYNLRTQASGYQELHVSLQMQEVIYRTDTLHEQ